METFIVYTITYGGEVKYVGKTSNMAKRKSMHRNQLGNPKYSAIPVDADLSKIEFNVVAEFNNEEEALKYEDELMLKYNTLDGGWNKIRSGLIMVNDVKAYYRDYNSAHKEERAEYQRDYNAAHKEEKAAYNRDYYQVHKEERAAYRAAHREEIAEYNRAYRARKRPR